MFMGSSGLVLLRANSIQKKKVQFKPNSKYEEERKKRNYLSARSPLLILLRLSRLIPVCQFGKVRGRGRSFLVWQVRSFPDRHSYSVPARV